MSAFDSANIAVVAYAEVVGGDGNSTATNSGVGTTRLSQGRYAVSLPAANTQQNDRDLIFVQPKSTLLSVAVGLARCARVKDDYAATKIVEIVDPVAGTATCVDSDFSILILRTQITPPTGAPA
jgi:hypothetical protein